MALALNNLKRVDMPLNKETKPNHSWGDKRVDNFPKSISPKLNAQAWLEFELVYFDVIVQHNSHCVREDTSAYFETGTFEKSMRLSFKINQEKYSSYNPFIDWLTDFNGMSTHLG